MNTCQTSFKFADCKFNVPLNSENTVHCRCLFFGKEQVHGLYGTVLGYLVWWDDVEEITLNIFKLLTQGKHDLLHYKYSPFFFLGTAGAVSTYILLYFTKLNPFPVCAKCWKIVWFILKSDFYGT